MEIINKLKIKTMKTMKTMKIACFVLGLTLITSSCKSSENAISAPKGEREITIPCSNFNSTKKTFRASAYGESKDMNIAKRKGLSNARTQLAGEISTTMKVVGDNYVKSTEFDNKEEILERFEENSRTVINEKLNGARSVCERTTQDGKTGKYKVYLALELSSEKVVLKYHELLSKDENLKVDYNYEKFKETFEKEMNKK